MSEQNQQENQQQNQSNQIIQQNESQQPDNQIKGDLVTLNQYLNELDREETLRNQLSTNKLTDKCRYPDGYIYQQVYSCETCYKEQIKYLSEEKQKDLEQNYKNNGQLMEYIKPHGICLGCMLHCHQDHEIVELYTKVDFKCDCGNSHMPFSCKLYNEKEYENPQNNYNTTFFDCYCYCQKPHTYEEMDQFMIQCFNCEDWYHNQHLSPKIEESLDQKYLLICSRCIQKKFQNHIFMYWNYFHQIILDHMQIDKIRTAPNKRQKISDNEEVIKDTNINCKNIDKLYLAIADHKIDIIIDDSFLDLICECEDCQQIFKKVIRHYECQENLQKEDKDLLNNLNGDINNEQEEIKETKELDSKRLDNIMLKTFNESTKFMSQEQQVYIAENLLLFKTKFYEFMKSFEISQKVLTPQDVNSFFEDLRAQKDLLLQKHFDIQRSK